MKSATAISVSEPPAEAVSTVRPRTGYVIALNGLLTLLIFLFFSVPDGGILIMTTLSGSLSYWLGALIIGLRRARASTRGDRLYFLAGQVVCVGLFLVALPIFAP